MRKAPTWRANYRCFEPSLRQVNIYVRVLGSGRYARWTQGLYWFEQNVHTFSLRCLVLPTPLLIDARSRGYKRVRERGRAPMSLMREWS
jgi:hypothetical protein